MTGNHRNQAAGADDLGVSSNLVLDPVYHSRHQGGVTVHQARLDSVDRVAPHHRLGSHQFHPAKLGCVEEEGVGGHADARRNDAAQVLTLPVYHVENGRSAQVHHDQRRRVQFNGGHGIGDAVCAHVPGRIVKNGQPRSYSRRYGEGGHAEIAVAQV